MGENKISEKDVQILLQRLIEWNALEIQISNDKREVLIPYVMNDAVEYYLRFEACTVHGNFEEDDGESDFSFVEHDSSKGLIIRQSSGNTISVWYQEIIQVIHCFQYHLIGHAWRKASGGEAIRRLVNLICVIHDKVTYLGEAHCSESEKELAALAEFPPVLYYTPINESILNWYPESQKGIDAAKELALQSGDTVCYHAFLQYETLYKKGKLKSKQVKITAEMLSSPIHSNLWLTLYKKIEAASMEYKERDYGMVGNQKIKEMRRQTEAMYRKLGYTGTYPLLRRTANGLGLGSNSENILFFAEEQPFTVMESDGFKYRIFSMMFSGDDLECVWKEECAWDMSEL